MEYNEPYTELPTFRCQFFKPLKWNILRPLQAYV